MRKIISIQFSILFIVYIISMLGCSANLHELSRECQYGNKRACRKLNAVAKRKYKKGQIYAHEAVDYLTDQAVLAEIAKTNKGSWIRKEATEKINNQIVLSEIVRTDDDPSVRFVATKKITDSKTLAEIANSDDDINVRFVAAEKINDLAVITEIAKTRNYDYGDFHKDKNPVRKELQTRIEAITHLTDQDVLAEIIRTDSYFLIHLAVVENLTDQAVLAEIANGHIHYDDDVQIKAIEKLNIESVLVDIAKTEYSLIGRTSKVREAAIKKLSSEMRETISPWLDPDSTKNISDSTLLAEIIENAGNTDVRIAAVNNLTDQVLLSEIAKSEWDDDVRKAAVEKITDQILLAEIAEKDKSLDVRLTAAGRIDNQAVLAEIATKPFLSSEFLRAAIDKLTNQAVLAEIVMTNDDPGVRKSAIDRVTDQSTLVTIAKTCRYGDVRNIATKKLPNELCNAHSAWIYPDSTKKLTNVDQLDEILKTAGNPVVREAAIDALTDMGNSKAMISILGALSDTSVSVLLKAIKSLSTFKHNSVDEVLVSIFANEQLHYLIEKAESETYIKDMGYVEGPFSLTVPQKRYKISIGDDAGATEIWLSTFDILKERGKSALPPLVRAYDSTKSRIVKTRISELYYVIIKEHSIDISKLGDDFRLFKLR